MNTEITPLWDDLLLRPYLGEVKKRHGYIETIALPNLRDLPPLRIDSMFINPLISDRPVDPNSKVEHWPDGMSLLTALERKRCIVLLGDPGSGKTTISNWLAWRLSAGLKDSLPADLEQYLPIPCILRELGEQLITTSRLIDVALITAKNILGNRFNKETAASIRIRVESGKFLLILDGADEIPVNQRKNVASWIKQAADMSGYCLATARIVGYEDLPLDRLPANKSTKQFNEVTNMSLHTSDLYIKHWAAVQYLMPFDNQRINSFVDNWYMQRCATKDEARQKAADLMTALGKSESMQNLARTPNLLSLMAIVHRERANLPNGTALLYKEICNAYINTIDQHRKITEHDLLAQYSWEIREGWLAFVGFQMQLIRNSSTSESSGILVGEQKVIEWLTSAMAMSHVDDPKTSALEFLKWIARRSGLLIPRGEDLYAFTHLSFQEYFCARFMSTQVMGRSFVRTSVSTNGYIDKEKIISWSIDPIWREAFIFFFEIISAENENGWVEEFLDLIFDFSEEEPFNNHQAKLAARILSNQHIHYSSNIKKTLVHRASEEGFDEWRYIDLYKDKIILRSLLETGFANIILGGDDDSESDQANNPQAYAVTASSIERSRQDSTILILHHVDESCIATLPSLDELRYASINRCQLTNIGFLRDAKNLVGLDTRKTPISTLTPLAGCKNLKQIDVSNSKVKNISWVSNFKNLEILNINDCAIKDYTPLTETNIRLLGLRGANLKNLTPITKIKGLFFLDLYNSSLANLNEIQILRNLYALGIGSTKIEDYSPLIELKSLSRLDADQCNARNPEIIGKLKNLNSLKFGFDIPLDLKFIGQLKKLEVLRLTGKGITDISFVSKMSNLKELRLSNTNIESISKKNIGPSLKTLTIDGEKINLEDLEKNGFLQTTRIQ